MSRKPKTTKKSIEKRNENMQNYKNQNSSPTINEGQNKDNDKVRIHTCFYVTKCFLKILDKF